VSDQEKKTPSAVDAMWEWLESRRNAPDITTLGMVQAKLLELFGAKKP
jgi:hypothetical protein